MIETNLGIVAASLFSLSPLFNPFFENIALDTFKLELKIDKVKLGVKRLGRESLTWKRIVMFLGYGEMRVVDTEADVRSRSTSRLGQLGGSKGNSREELSFEMGIIKTTEVIVSREGSDIWEYREDRREEV